MRLDVTRQPRIGVDPPGSPDVVFPVEDGEAAKAGSRQQYSQSQLPGPAPMMPTESVAFMDLQASATVDDEFRTGDEGGRVGHQKCYSIAPL